MHSSTTFATLSLLVSLAMITAAPVQSPQSTIKDLTKEENQLQSLKGSDRKLDGSTSALNKDINKELATVDKQEGKLTGLKSKDTAVEKKEKAAGKKINSDVKQLGIEQLRSISRRNAPSRPSLTKPEQTPSNLSFSCSPPSTKPRQFSR
ncbi:hypothetical protein C8J56DRAFT_891908 [Mycena floridula]|nr:hypothetical protein C8J56DRAFT_891908 [Mycena floridula]